jgi:hypothetical protein
MKNIIEGSKVPNSKVNRNVRITFSKELMNEYLPIINELYIPRGLKYLAIIMTIQEGFIKGSRSYRHNNPANIGNTDDGSNKSFKTLKQGVDAQIKYIIRVSEGKHKAYPLGKVKTIKPYFSPETGKIMNGYRFLYTGKLEQFVKIYATGARNGNAYLSLIISYFDNLGLEINEETTIAEIINI